MVALPPTDKVLLPGIVTPPISVDASLTDSEPVIVAPPPVTFMPFATVTCPSPFTVNTAADVPF
jgi:hypothetical protein